MKIFLIISGVFLTVAAVAVGVLIFSWGDEAPITPPPSGTNQSPSYTSTVTPPGPSGTQGGESSVQSTITVLSVDGAAITVRNFKEDSTVKAFPNDSGDYILAGGEDPSVTNAPYSMIYVASDQSFTVSLLVEPLGQFRLQAEKELLQKLGISTATACLLRYQVLTPYRVNPLYSGKNLGFSFCPGATPL